MTFVRSSGRLTSLTVCNRPDWWSSNSITVSDGSSSACPPPVGSTLEGAVGPACAKALGLGDKRPIARDAAMMRKALFNTTNIGSLVMVHLPQIEEPGCGEWA